MNAAILIGLLFSVAVLAQAQRNNSACLRLSVGGQVNAGKSFRQPLGNGLVLHLDPLKDDSGWQAAISPEGSDDDWAYPVNLPLRFGNSEYLGTGYGEPVREVLSYAHVIRFPLTYEDYSRISNLAREALWPDQSKQKATAAYLDALKTVKTGAVVLSPLDYDKDGPPEKTKWMKFNAIVVIPQGFMIHSELHWTTGSCSIELPSGKKLSVE